MKTTLTVFEISAFMITGSPKNKIGSFVYEDENDVGVGHNGKIREYLVANIIPSESISGGFGKCWNIITFNDEKAPYRYDCKYRKSSKTKWSTKRLEVSVSYHGSPKEKSKQDIAEQ